jgi:leucyl aminopeptidase
VPDAATVVGVPVYADGAVPDRQAHHRATLEASGFGATVGETLVLPRVEGPTIVEVGLGPHAEITKAALRDAAAAFARAAVRHRGLVFDASAIGELPPADIGQAVVEGVLLARYRYRGFIDQPAEAHLTELTIVTAR